MKVLIGLAVLCVLASIAWVFFFADPFMPLIFLILANICISGAALVKTNEIIERMAISKEGSDHDGNA